MANSGQKSARPIVVRPEIGYQLPVFDWSFMLGAPVPELRWPQSIHVFSRMRTDSQVAAMLDAVTLPIMSTGWYIDPNGASDEVVGLVCSDLGLPVRGADSSQAPLRTRDKFSFAQHLRLALLHLTYGHSFFEQVYRVEDGYAHLHKLAWRPPETIAKIDVALDGGLIAIQQHSTALSPRVPTIPVERLVAYVNRREGANWAGQSQLTRAYKYFKLKEELLRLLAVADQRNGMGLPVYTAAPALDLEDDLDKIRQDIQDDMDAGAEMVKASRAGDEAGIVLGPGAKFDLVGVNGKLPDIMGHIRYCDDQIAASVLAHFLNLGQQSGTGSYGLGATFVDFFVQSLQTVATDIADVINQHVIEDLVDVNFGTSVPAPRLVFDEIGAKHPATAEALSILTNSGVLLPEPALESHVREIYGLPPKAPYTSATKKDGATDGPTTA